MGNTRRNASPDKPVSLRVIADHLGLSPATISAVINDSPAARTIPESTKLRVLQAVEQFEYRPNYMAQSLRRKRSFTVAVVVPEVSEGYCAEVIGGIEDQLAQQNYLYFVASHHGNRSLLGLYPRLLLNRGVEGFIFVNTPPEVKTTLPVVAISARTTASDVSDVILDNKKAVQLALNHLSELGHRKIAFLKGHPGSADTEPRWRAIVSTCKKLDIAMDPDLAVQLRGCTGEHEPSTPDEGYVYAKKLIDTGKRFTALFAFNDMSAIGAISALHDAGLRVPDDVSVVGFDDIKAAAFQNPRLTTVRQPLKRMGELAAADLLARIADPQQKPREILVEPELIIRESTKAVARVKVVAR